MGGRGKFLRLPEPNERTKDMGITPEDMVKISQEMEKAKEDTTPHVGVASDNIFVIGDANKTENKKRDYRVLMRYPQEYGKYVPKEDIFGYNAGQVYFYVDFKDVQVTPRGDIKIMTKVAKIIPFFQKLDAAGDLDKMSEDELIQVAVSVGDEVLDAMYDAVGVLLGMDNDTVSHMDYTSVISMLVALFRDFPEVFNEADFSLGSPTEKA